MAFYEVLIADSKYQSDDPLTYHYDGNIKVGSVVSVPLRGRQVNGFIFKGVAKPKFKTLEIKSILSEAPVPAHFFKLAEWLKDYYSASYSDALRQFTPSRTVRRKSLEPTKIKIDSLKNDFKPTTEQTLALKKIRQQDFGTYLLHGQTGSGKTYVYKELIKDALDAGQSAIILVPEIALTTQVQNYIESSIKNEVVVFHSHLSPAKRKKLWFKVLESAKPIVVIGARSALFTPVQNLGIVIVDECHEQTYKQEQSPRYNALRTASKLGEICGSKVVFGSATPSIYDYFIAERLGVIVTMNELAVGKTQDVETIVVDLKDKSEFSRHQFISTQMINKITQTVNAGQQCLIYLNRRGSARLVMCEICGWQLLCPNCDIPLTYHADEHKAVCHSCGYKTTPPNQCQNCDSPDIIYKSVGTKAVTETLKSLFPDKVVARFDGDNKDGDRFEQNFHDILEGKVDIIVGTQIISKGLDLPKLGMVGVVIADTALYLPDYTANEKTFQVTYQLLGRVGRGHSDKKSIAIIQTYNPVSKALLCAINKDYKSFYEDELKERQAYRFPPYSYMLKLTCRRRTVNGAQIASDKLYNQLASELKSSAQVIGPMPSFQYKKAGSYNMQIVVKAKSRTVLLDAVKNLPTGWTADLDPINLL